MQGKSVLAWYKTCYGMFRGRNQRWTKGGIKVVWGATNVGKQRDEDMKGAVYHPI